MAKTILFYGAGAINRGFFPWVFPPGEFEYFFIDKDPDLMKQVNDGYTTHRTVEDCWYAHLKISPLKELPSHPDCVVIAVGPRNTLSLTDRFMKSEVPIIIAENDSRLPMHFSAITGNPNVAFAVPDVITSNGFGNIKEADSADIITETGVCYITDTMSFLGGEAIYCDAETMRTEYIRKMYLHNTPHCIAAYLGYQAGVRYVHEAMDVPGVAATIQRVMNECVEMIYYMYHVDREGSYEYIAKEIRRFANPLLCDPIHRVAREPLRKLAQGDRLVGAAALCLQAGIKPTGIVRGIEAACQYIYSLSDDYQTMKYARRMTTYQFLSFIGIGESEPVMKFIKENTPDSTIHRPKTQDR